MGLKKLFIQIVLLIGFICVSRIYAADGGFQPVVSLSAGVSPRGVAVGNVYGNGSQCFIVANFGSPTFIGQSTPVSLLNPVNSNVQVFSPSPTGLKLTDTISTASSPRGLYPFEFAGKNRQDLFVTAYDASLLQVFGWSGGKFVKLAEAPTLLMPVGVTAGLTRVGGIPFVAVADYGSNNISLFPLKGGKLGKRVDIPVDGGPTQLAIGDLKGDGNNEIAVVCLTSNKVDILSAGTAEEGNDLPPFTVTQTLSLPDGSAPSDLRIADLNNDGRADLVVSEFLKNSINIFLQQKDGSLAAQPALSTSGNRPNGLNVADLFGNGSEVIIVANRDSDSLDLFQNNQGQYQLTQTLKVANDPDSSFGPVEIGALDTRETGLKDLVVSHMRSNTIKIIAQSLPSGSTYTAQSLSLPPGRPSFSEKTTYCYPNPSRDGNVTFTFQLAGPSSVSIQVFDIQGEKVWGENLAAGQTQGGTNTVSWQGVNQSGQNLASGLYIYTITAGDQTVTKKLAIVH